ncbi:MAG: hypothetical protein QXQ81_09130 [Candidatus Thorarchaeota archaeon]
MSEPNSREKFLRAIKKCLSDVDIHFQKAIDELDQVGRASLGLGMTPILGRYGIRDPSKHYTNALIELDLAEKSLQPLRKRLGDGTVNASHFTSEKALVMLRDLCEFDYDILVNLLANKRGKESVGLRLVELDRLAVELLNLVAHS